MTKEQKTEEKQQMSADQYRACLASLNLTQNASARLFGVNDRTGRRWASPDEQDERDIPRAVQLCLALMIKFKITAEEVEDILKKRLKKI